MLLKLPRVSIFCLPNFRVLFVPKILHKQIRPTSQGSKFDTFGLNFFSFNMAYRDWGAKTGGGGVASADHEALARRERLRQLTMDTIDLSQDPYFMRNHLGTYECKLCLTLHANEGNYLAHTQGRRHQSNLARRAALDLKSGVGVSAGPGAVCRPAISIGAVPRARTPRIGRPGYEVTKQRDAVTGAASLLFQIAYPEIAVGFQPRHRFMSVFEQRVERPDKRYQYLLFAAEPYETIGFRIPNRRIDRAEGRFFTQWDPERRKFTLQLFFEKRNAPPAVNANATANVNSALQTEKSITPNPFAGIGTS